MIEVALLFGPTAAWIALVFLGAKVSQRRRRAAGAARRDVEEVDVEALVAAIDDAERMPDGPDRDTLLRVLHDRIRTAKGADGRYLVAPPMGGLVPIQAGESVIRVPPKPRDAATSATPPWARTPAKPTGPDPALRQEIHR